MHYGLEHDWSEQSALSRAFALAFALLGSIRARFPYDGPVPLSTNAPIAITQTSGISGSSGKSSRWTEPSTGPQEEEGNHVSLYCTVPVCLSFHTHLVKNGSNITFHSIKRPYGVFVMFSFTFSLTEKPCVRHLSLTP